MSWVGAGGFKRWFDKMGQVSRSMPWYCRLITALILIGALILLTDLLAVAVRGVVENSDQSWLWGLREESSSDQPAAAPGGVRLASVHLLVMISGDELTARYTATSSSGQALVADTQAAQSAGNSDAMVSDLLGQVSVAQFRDGITGNQLEWTTLGFMTPQLQATGNNTTVTIGSNPFRLLLGQQQIQVKPPATPADGSPGDLEFTYPSGLQLLDVAGARLASTASGQTDLQRDDGTATAVLRETGANWTTGLRSIGGINLPVIGAQLQRLASLVVYVVLLWSLTRICRNLSQLRRDVQSVVVVSVNAVSAIVGALIALSVLGFSYQLMFEIVPRSRVGPLLAGPTGLVVAGAIVLWPVACWRVTPARDGVAGGNRVAARRRWRELVAMVLMAVAYVIILVTWPGVHQVTWWQAGPAILGMVVLVYLLGTLVLGWSDRRPPVPSGALAGLLAVVLGSTLAWPVLVYTGFFKGRVLYVNLIGKWIYFTAAIITIIGLCVMTARVIRVLSASHLRHLRSQPAGYRRATGVPRSPEKTCRMWQWIWRAGGGGVIAVTLAATVPYLINQSQIRDSHAEGLVPAGLASYSGLYRALPQLLNWLLLALAIAVLLSISRAAHLIERRRNAVGRTAAYRVAARQLAIPVMMLILFSAYTYYYRPWAISNYTWLYLPVTPILGLMILVWVLPAKQATTNRTLQPGKAIQMTLQAWRTAEFADKQRQTLMSNADDLRKAALKPRPPTTYDRTFSRLTQAQSRLAEQHDAWQRKAHANLAEAFDHHGEPPDPKTGRQGALAGTLLGLAPAVILFLVTRPVSAWSGYPILDFLGFTAWILFIWPALGWAMGYFLPFIRGRNGTSKALWVYAVVGASLPMNLLWLDGHEWKITAIYYLELFAFLVIIGVILGDLMALVSAGMSPLAWIQVHNWRFLVTWSTAVLAAIGTAAVTFLSTAAMDLGQQTATAVTGQSAPGSTSVQGSTSHGP
jgi:hypothetical protein